MASREVLRGAASGAGLPEHFQINLSVPLLFGYEDVLSRPQSGIELSAEAISDVLDFHCSVVRLHRVFFLWRPHLRDPKDDMVLELAVTAGCQVIVTFNERDLAGAEDFGIRVLPPKVFLQEIGAL